MECAGRKSEAVLEIRTLATCSLVIPSRLTACATASTALPCALCHMKKLEAEGYGYLLYLFEKLVRM